MPDDLKQSWQQRDILLHFIRICCCGPKLGPLMTQLVSSVLNVCEAASAGYAVPRIEMGSLGFAQAL